MSACCCIQPTLVDDSFPESYDVQGLSRLGRSNIPFANNIDVAKAYHTLVLEAHRSPRGARTTTQKAAIETHSDANEDLKNRQTNIRNLLDLAHEHTAGTGHLYTREDCHYVQHHGIRTRRYLQGCGAQQMSRE